jgi:hypothetical protein
MYLPQTVRDTYGSALFYIVSPFIIISIVFVACIPLGGLVNKRSCFTVCDSNICLNDVLLNYDQFGSGLKRAISSWNFLDDLHAQTFPYVVGIESKERWNRFISDLFNWEDFSIENNTLIVHNICIITFRGRAGHEQSPLFIAEVDMRQNALIGLRCQGPLEKARPLTESRHMVNKDDISAIFDIPATRSDKVIDTCFKPKKGLPPPELHILYDNNGAYHCHSYSTYEIGDNQFLSRVSFSCTGGCNRSIIK